MLGQRERLDWCVREIERLKKFGEEKQGQCEQVQNLKHQIEQSQQDLIEISRQDDDAIL